MHPRYILFLVCLFMFPQSCFCVPLNSHERPSSAPFISGDTFRHLSNHVCDETHVVLRPENVKPGDVVFVSCYEQNIMDSYFKNMHTRIKVPYILVSHNTDHWIPGKFEAYLNDPHIIAWFSQNIDRDHPKLHPLPIGLANYHWPHGKIELVRSALQCVPSLDQKINKVYVNFLIDTNRKVRQPVWDFFKTKSFCVPTSKTSFGNYLNDMKRYRFVLCPPGNGIDCHRTWEALLMGCIPIIKHSPIDRLFENLPIILINDWTEITEDFLEKQYQEIMQNYDAYNMTKLYIDYWITQIECVKHNFLETLHQF